MTTIALEDLKIPNGAAGGTPDGPVLRVERCPRRVRAVLDGHAVADSTAVKYLFERDHLPVYYFPVADIDAAVMVQSDKRTHCPRKGDATYWSVQVAERLVPDAIWGYEQPIEAAREIAGHVALYWNAFDHWYEEDQEVFVHARNPYKRIDVLPSSRHVRVELEGTVLAETRRPSLLFETGLPTRFYIPRSDVAMELLRSSETITACPYKGRASYYSAALHERTVDDIAWTYPFPIPEAPRLEQLICFYDERVDTWVDGVQLARPVTPWS